MEENRENNTTISETTDAEEAVSAANEEPQEAVPEVDHDVPDVVPKKRSVKKVLAALLDIFFVCNNTTPISSASKSTISLWSRHARHSATFPPWELLSHWSPLILICQRQKSTRGKIYATAVGRLL